MLMCAEAVPWRCHRSLIADALLARGIDASGVTVSHSPNDFNIRERSALGTHTLRNFRRHLDLP